MKIYAGLKGLPGDSAVKNLSARQKMQEMPWVPSLGPEDPLEEGIATQSRILALENPMDRGACQATVHRVVKSDTTEVTEHTCTS